MFKIACLFAVWIVAASDHQEVTTFHFKDFTRPEFAAVGNVDGRSSDAASQTLGTAAPIDLLKFSAKPLPRPTVGKVLVYDIETTKITKREETFALFFSRTVIDREPKPSFGNKLPKTVELGNQLKITVRVEPVAEPTAALELPLTATATEVRVQRSSHVRVKLARTDDIVFSERAATREEEAECQKEALRRFPKPQFEGTRVKNVRVLPGNVNTVSGEVELRRFR